MVGKKLRMNPDALYYAVRLLVEEGDVESDALDLQAVRATLRGWMKFPPAGATRRDSAHAIRPRRSSRPSVLLTRDHPIRR